MCFVGKMKNNMGENQVYPCQLHSVQVSIHVGIKLQSLRSEKEGLSVTRFFGIQISAVNFVAYRGHQKCMIALEKE